MTGDIPEPRETAELLGHEVAETTLCHALGSKRLHHAWLLCGPRGIGKATLAYRFARYLLARPPFTTASDGPGLFGDLSAELPQSLYLAADHPVFRQVAAGAHPDLMTVRRGLTKEGRERSEIIVDDVRAVVDFFAKTSAAGGWRIAIIDSVDELNRSSANALLKVLEEPPGKSVLLLVAHMPGRVLPTLRSRCRRLTLRPLPRPMLEAALAARLPELGADDRRLAAALADGSLGMALQLLASGGIDLYRQLVSLLADLPSIDAKTMLGLADELSGRGAEDRFRLFGDLLGGLLGRIACVAGGGSPGLVVPGETETLHRLAAEGGITPWVELWQRNLTMMARTDALTLDRKQVTMTLLDDLQRALQP